jgi:hypothetical protein
MKVSTTICGLIDLRRHAALGILTLAVVIPMLLTGCALSVEPVILESKAVFDARLTGNWEPIDGSEWATTTADGKEYWIEYRGKGLFGDWDRGSFAPRTLASPQTPSVRSGRGGNQRFGCTPASEMASDDPGYRRIRMARPTGGMIAVENLSLQRDAFRFTFSSGTFHLIDNGEGTSPIGAVFIGRGSYELDPSSESERRHLRLVTRDRELERLSDQFEQLVMLFSDTTPADLEAAGALRRGAADPQAVRHYSDYLRQQKSRLQLNLHLRLLRDALNQTPAIEEVFLASVTGRKHGHVLAVFDPAGIGNLAAGLAIFGGEEVALISLDDQKGGLWYLGSRGPRTENARGRALKQVVDAQHYKVETTIASNLAIHATTTIRLVALSPGIRVLPLHILPKLRLSEASYIVEGEESLPVGIVQEEIDLGRLGRLVSKEVADADAAVIFPTALPTGRAIELRLQYAGREVLHAAGPDSWLVGARESWYPNLGTFTDPATYELHFRYPSRQQLIATGTLVNERSEGNQKIAEWKSDGEIRVAGFNYGRFEKRSRSDEQSGARIDVYTHRNFRKTAGDQMVDALNAARVGTHFFGKTPYSAVSITQQVEWYYGQSWPGLIFLPTLALTTSTERAFMFLGPHAFGVQEFAKMVGWHEYAHQWWGHQVGWQSYRDAWLSEGFAEFTAALVLQLTEGMAAYEKYWGRRRREILEKNSAGRVNAEVGPISNGMRLQTSYSPGAYQTLVYYKGAYVLHMLRMMMLDSQSRTPDEKFINMMRDFVATHAGRSPSTEDFQKVVEKHMTPGMNASGNGSMSWFFDQWIYGTEIPKLTSALAIAKSGEGRYRIHGTVTQSGVSETYKSVVPIYVEFEKDNLARLGQLIITGSGSLPVDFEIPLPAAPRRVVVNAMGDVLARN